MEAGFFINKKSLLNYFILILDLTLENKMRKKITQNRKSQLRIISPHISGRPRL